MINAQEITRRMLNSTSAAAPDSKLDGPGRRALVVRGYLKAFGIVQVPSLASAPSYPPVFKPKHSLEWNAHLRDVRARIQEGNAPFTDDESYLRLILEFLRYMKHMGVNPFISSIKPPRAALEAQKFSIQGTYTDLLYASMSATAAQILASVRATHLLVSLAPAKTARTSVKKINGVLTLCSAFNLRPRRARQSLDEVLSTLQGFLYRSAQPPAALQQQWAVQAPKIKSKPVSRLLRTTILMSSTSTVGWLLLAKRPDFQLCMRRSRENTLVLNILVPVETQDTLYLGPRARQILISTWTKSIAEFK